MMGQPGHHAANMVDDAGEAKRRKLDVADSDPKGRDKAKTGGERPAALRMREKILAVERDYTHYFVLDVGGEEGADQYVFQHFNTLCLVGVAPSSIVFKGGRRVVQVDFDVGRGGDKEVGNKVSGKKKHGATYLTEESRLCDLVCDDGTRVKVRSSVAGHLLEVNSRLKEQPDLINSKAATEGFIAIIQPKKDFEQASNLLARPEYEERRMCAREVKPPP